MNNIFSLVTSETINKIIDQAPHKIYEAVKTAYIRHGQGQAINPPSYFLSFPDKEKARIIALPALTTQNPRIAGIKWISSNPDNLKSNLKRASAVIILNNYETGYPIACLEGSIISALRTVYSAILVSEYLLDTRAKQTIGIVGAGNLSEKFVQCINNQNWLVDKIILFDLDAHASIRLQEKITQINPTIEISVVKELKELITKSPLIFFSTTSSVPYVTELSWLTHNPIILNISLRDLAPEVLITSNNIVDDIKHVLNANTSPHLTQQKYGHSDFINCTVSELINGYNKFDNAKTTIFSPMGMGILDLVVASYIYDEAVKENLDIKVKNFFGE